MSPVSRGRKGRRKSKKVTQRAVPLEVFDAPDACDCPACSGADFDPERLIDELIASAADLVVAEDPLDAELAGAGLVSVGSAVGEGYEELLLDGCIPAFEARATPEALAVLLAIGSVAEDRVGKAASAAADRLVEARVQPPAWAAELGEPVTVADCWHLRDPQGTESALACTFHRAGRSHAVAMTVDHLDCGAAREIFLADADQLPETLEKWASVQPDGIEFTTEAVDAAELRWQFEKALAARAVHDSDQLDPGIGELPADEDRLPDYPALALFLRTRMNALPMSSKPIPPHGSSDDNAGLSALEVLIQHLGNGPNPFPRLGGRTTPAKLPAKRKKSDGPAPIYQIKVGLQGAKPPIWRRLEVPADISLARLHTVIQIAFDWEDSHMHVFDTPYGEFGIADADLGHRREAPVTLEQVAPGVRSKIRYTYDFGDDWTHDILVEKVLNRDEAVRYPRCTGGRRAAPPEDCGGIWGYAELTDALTDPAHPEHEARLEWLGLGDAAGFDPAAFDPQAVSQALSRLR